MSWVQEIVSAGCQSRPCISKSYACLEQPETLDFLPYLTIADSGDESQLKFLNFNSEGSESNKSSKKGKKFSFDGIYKRTQKMKHQFAKLIKEVASDALKGENQTFFIYGTDQACKDKIIFGQSQNPGLFLCILSEIFDACHKKSLQDEVTIKLSCSVFNKARFMDIFGGNPDFQIEYQKDMLEGNVLHTVPQIIIRNVKSGLKLLNIMLKQLSDSREQQLTENLLLTLKLELDCQRNQQESSIYCLSKISFIKLANPSVNSSLKGVNKNNIWFINLLNYLQSSALANHGPTAEIQSNQTYPVSEGEDEFTSYIRETYFKNSHKIFGFVSITNKMNSNECLTALLFANYLKNSKAESSKTIINIPNIMEERGRLYSAIFKTILKSEEYVNDWIQYCRLLEEYMTEINYLEFQYSLILGEACQKLNKYIFTEELEDFFYAKRTNVQKSEDLYETYENVSRIRNKIALIERKIIEKTAQKVEKRTLQKLFELEKSLAYHFLLDLTKTTSILNEAQAQLSKQKVEVVVQEKKQNKEDQKAIEVKSFKIENYSEIQRITKKQKKDQIPNRKEGHCSNHSRNENSSKVSKKPSNENIDNLESMFKNKNVGIANKKLR